jgi:hypothetical protein
MLLAQKQLLQRLDQGENLDLCQELGLSAGTTFPNCAIAIVGRLFLGGAH